MAARSSITHVLNVISGIMTGGLRIVRGSYGRRELEPRMGYSISRAEAWKWNEVADKAYLAPT